MILIIKFNEYVKYVWNYWNIIKGGNLGSEASTVTNTIVVFRVRPWHRAGRLSCWCRFNGFIADEHHRGSEFAHGSTTVVVLISSSLEGCKARRDHRHVGVLLKQHRRPRLQPALPISGFRTLKSFILILIVKKIIQWTH